MPLFEAPHCIDHWTAASTIGFGRTVTRRPLLPPVARRGNRRFCQVRRFRVVAQRPSFRRRRQKKYHNGPRPRHPRDSRRWTAVERVAWNTGVSTGVSWISIDEIGQLVECGNFGVLRGQTQTPPVWDCRLPHYAVFINICPHLPTFGWFVNVGIDSYIYMYIEYIHREREIIECLFGISL